MRFACLIAVAIAVTCGASLPAYHENLPLDDPAIRYNSAPPEDGIQGAAEALTNWDSPLRNRLARLERVLRVLDISPDSQTLVFSKTSFQAHLISPRNPRAVYFGLNYAVGYVRGSPLIEVAALDARGGARFYTFNLDAEKPVFERQQSCLRCHNGPATQGVPGMFVGSVFPDREGNAARDGAIITDHRTPFAERWGGWFVDGLNPASESRANKVAESPVVPEVLTPIAKPPLEGYLRKTSDPTALLALERGTQAANLLTRLSWLARMAEQKPSDLVVLRNELVAAKECVSYLRSGDVIRSRVFTELPEPAKSLIIFKLQQSQ